MDIYQPILCMFYSKCIPSLNFIKISLTDNVIERQAYTNNGIYFIFSVAIKINYNVYTCTYLSIFCKTYKGKIDLWRFYEALKTIPFLRKVRTFSFEPF